MDDIITMIQITPSSRSLHNETINDGASDLLESNYLSTGLKVFGSILCAIIIILALGFGCWTYINSRKRVVRSSQPIFLYMICAGTLLMGLSIIPFTVDLGVTDQAGANAACVSFPWLISIGFSWSFSALFTKTYRINKIMENAAHFKRLKVTAMSVEKPMAVLLLLNVIVLTVWTAMDPLQHETVINIDPFNTETYGVCTSDHGYIFLAILGVINIGSLAIAVFQAYKARNHSKELHESRYIFMIVGLFLVVSFIGIPVIVMARENTEVFYFVVVAMIFVGCASILLLLFVPKVQRHRSGRAGGAWNASRRSSMLTTLGHSRRASQQEKLFLISVFEMAISPEQLNIVQTSWEKVVPIADVAADLFYNKLFELDPTLRPLFPDDLTDQKGKLLAMLTVAVESLTDLKDLLPKVEQLGRRHILYYGVTASMFPTVGAALLDTLEKGLGDSWDGAHKEAWALVYGVLSTTMMEAGEKAERRQSVARASMIERSSEPRNEKETAAETFVDQ